MIVALTTGTAPDPAASDSGGTREAARYVVVASPRSLLLCVVSSMMVAFAAGRAARTALPLGGAPLGTMGTEIGTLSRLSWMARPAGGAGDDMRVPTWGEDKGANGREEAGACEANQGRGGGYHPPPCQHLLVDIGNVDGSFLSSPERLAQATEDFASRLSPMSHHRCSVLPGGVSCVWLMSGGGGGPSHVSLLTRAYEGLISLDLFTCDSKPVVSALLPVIERLFSVPRPGGTAVKPPPETVWALRLRGFRSDDGCGGGGGGGFDAREEEVASARRSPHRRFGNHKARRESPLDLDGDVPKSPRHPGRLPSLDGELRSAPLDDAVQSEALVHPAMFSHSLPRRVAILSSGGVRGSGAAALREVLKHRTVSRVVAVVESDGAAAVEGARGARNATPYASDRSDSVGASDRCEEGDPRAEVTYADGGGAGGWLVRRFGGGGRRPTEGEPFDVIIVDDASVLEPQNSVPSVGDFRSGRDDDEAVIRTLFDGLSERGVLVVRFGESPTINDPARGVSRHRDRARVIELIEEVGFESIHVYEEGHGSPPLRPLIYLAAFKDYDTRALWYSDAATVDMHIHQRIAAPAAARSAISHPLEYFDGATMRTYQVPHKIFETSFCRAADPAPEECGGAGTAGGGGGEGRLKNVPLSSFKVGTSRVGDGSAGRGLFAKVDIEEGSPLHMEQSVAVARLSPSATEVVYRYCESGVGEEVCLFRDWVEGYGWQVNAMGEEAHWIDSGVSTFVNHGCNGTYNMGKKENKPWLTELTVDLKTVPQAYRQNSGERRDIYNPAMDRHMMSVFGGGDVALRDIRAGEEILNNYMDFVSGDEEEWEHYIGYLREVCKGENIGLVTQYETMRRSNK